MAYIPAEIRRLADSIGRDAGSAERLLDIASESYYDLIRVAKAVIHFENSGDPEKAEAIGPLILDLEEMEWRKHSIHNVHGIPGSLTACLAKGSGKEALSKAEVEMHEIRALFVLGVMEELGGIRGIRLVGPLIAALKDDVSEEAAEKLLASLEGKPLGEGNAETMKSLIRICCKAMTDEKAVRWIKVLLPQIIEEGENDTIHWLAPLVEACKDRSRLGTAVFLLNELEGSKDFGVAGTGTVMRLERTMREANNDPERSWWPMTFKKKLSSHGLNLKIPGLGHSKEGPRITGTWRRKLRERDRAETARLRSRPLRRTA